jgi:hypothetical protein
MRKFVERTGEVRENVVCGCVGFGSQGNVRKEQSEVDQTGTRREESMLSRVEELIGLKVSKERPIYHFLHQFTGDAR